MKSPIEQRELKQLILEVDEHGALERADIDWLFDQVARVPEWQPIETAPKDETWIVLYHPTIKLGAWYWDGNVWNDDTMIWSERDGCGPAYWMPLPPEPKIEKKSYDQS